MRKLRIIEKWEQFIDNKRDIRVEKIKEIDNIGSIEVLYSSFSKFVKSKEELLNKIRPRLNNDISICLKLDNKIIGVYLLNNKSINDFIESIYKDEVSDFKIDDTIITLTEQLSDNGIQGIALSVLPEYRGMGYGNLLKEHIKKSNYDYIWGVQDKKLNNIHHWLKTRKIFAESSTRYATYVRL
jgi:hypothetical protein